MNLIFFSLDQIGFIWKNKNIKIKFNVLICDAPAKAFITYVKGHTGYHGCSKCIQEGEFINCVTFSELGCTLRTDKSFKVKQDEEHHIGLSELELLGIGMVRQVTCI